MGGGSRVHEFFLFYVGPITIVAQESIFAFCICGALSPREFDSLLEMPLFYWQAGGQGWASRALWPPGRDPAALPPWLRLVAAPAVLVC